MSDLCSLVTSQYNEQYTKGLHSSPASPTDGKSVSKSVSKTDAGGAAPVEVCKITNEEGFDLPVSASVTTGDILQDAQSLIAMCNPKPEPQAPAKSQSCSNDGNQDSDSKCCGDGSDSQATSSTSNEDVVIENHTESVMKTSHLKPSHRSHDDAKVKDTDTSVRDTPVSKSPARPPVQNQLPLNTADGNSQSDQESEVVRETPVDGVSSKAITSLRAESSACDSPSPLAVALTSSLAKSSNKSKNSHVVRSDDISQSSRSSSRDRSSPSLLNALATAAAARSSTRRNASKDTEFDSTVSPKSTASSVAAGGFESSLLTPSQTLLMMSEVAMRKSKARQGYRSGGSDENGSSEGDAETQARYAHGLSSSSSSTSSSGGLSAALLMQHGFEDDSKIQDTKEAHPRLLCHADPTQPCDQYCLLARGMESDEDTHEFRGHRDYRTRRRYPVPGGSNTQPYAVGPGGHRLLATLRRGKRKLPLGWTMTSQPQQAPSAAAHKPRRHVYDQAVSSRVPLSRPKSKQAPASPKGTTGASQRATSSPQVSLFEHLKSESRMSASKVRASKIAAEASESAYSPRQDCCTPDCPPPYRNPSSRPRKSQPSLTDLSRGRMTIESVDPNEKPDGGMQERVREFLSRARHPRPHGPAEGSHASCHQCKKNKLSSELLYCTYDPGKVPAEENTRNKVRRCRKKYCAVCLSRYLAQHVIAENFALQQLLLTSGNTDGARLKWSCPSCENHCSCAACERNRGKFVPKRKTVNKSSPMASIAFPDGMQPQVKRQKFDPDENCDSISGEVAGEVRIKRDVDGSEDAAAYHVDEERGAPRSSLASLLEIPFARSKPPESRSNVLRCAVASCRKAFRSVSDFNAHTQNAHNMSLPSHYEGESSSSSAGRNDRDTVIKLEKGGSDRRGSRQTSPSASKCNSGGFAEECDCCGPADNEDMSDEFESHSSSSGSSKSASRRSSVPPPLSSGVVPKKRSRATSATSSSGSSAHSHSPVLRGSISLVASSSSAPRSMSKRQKFTDRSSSTSSRRGSETQERHSEFRGMAPLTEILPAPLFASQPTYCPGGVADTSSSYSGGTLRSNGVGPSLSPLSHNASFPKTTKRSSPSPKSSATPASGSPSGPRARVVGSTSNPLLEAGSKPGKASKRFRLVGMTAPPAEDEQEDSQSPPTSGPNEKRDSPMTVHLASPPSLANSMAHGHPPATSPVNGGNAQAFSPGGITHPPHAHVDGIGGTPTSFAQQHQPLIKLEKLPAAALPPAAMSFNNHIASPSFFGGGGGGAPSALPPPLPLHAAASALPMPRRRVSSASDFDLSTPNLTKF